MKRVLKVLTAALALCMPIAAVPAATAEAVTVGGGTDTVVFDESGFKDFDYYSEFDNQRMFVMQNRLYAPVLAETKAVYKYGTYGDAEVSVDIAPINPKGYIDGGIYVQASGANNAMDGITAWNVNVEHAVGSSVVAVKLHRFENNKWQGAKKEVFNIKYTSDTVHLRVVVKTGVLHAYYNGEQVFTYYIGTNNGKVGIRNFYAPAYYENFVVTSPDIAVLPSALNNKLASLENFDYAPYTEQSADVLRAAVERGKAAATGQSQAEVDDAYAAILQAEQALIRIKTRDDIAELAEQANAIISQPEKYTQNSVGSLRIVLAQIEQASDEDIPQLYSVLQKRIDSAVKYEGGDDE